jgi:hypothetical protein
MGTLDPDFEDSGAAWGALKATMREANKPLCTAAAKLLDAGLEGQIVPLAWGPPALVLLVGPVSTLGQAIGSTPDVRAAFELRRQLPVETASLLRYVRDALDAAGGASSLMLPLPHASPTAYVLAGDFGEISQLVLGQAP